MVPSGSEGPRPAPWGLPRRWILVTSDTCVDTGNSEGNSLTAAWRNTGILEE